MLPFGHICLSFMYSEWTQKLQKITDFPSLDQYNVHQHILEEVPSLWVNAITPCKEHVWFDHRTILGCQMSAPTHRSIHHQKSSSDSPLHANTAVPEGHSGVIIKRRVKQKEQTNQLAQAVAPCSATAAATAFWVEKMLQAAQRHWAPSVVKVSISTCRMQEDTV